MTEQNLAIVKLWFDEVWNNRRDDLVEELLSADSKAHGLKNAKGQTPVGHEGFRELFFAFSDAFPDLHISIDDIVIENDMVVTRCTVSGTHLGAGMGIAPTGRHVMFSGLCMMKIRNGKIDEVWNQFDFINMYQQIGALSFTAG